jgi:uncharacterized protein (TIGR00251 family)
LSVWALCSSGAYRPGEDEMLTDHAAGCVLAVQVVPRARRTGIQGRQGDALKVAVAAPPDKGQANQALLSCLCQALALRPHQIELLRGASSRHKLLLIRGLSSAQLQQRLQPFLTSAAGGSSPDKSSGL